MDTWAKLWSKSRTCCSEQCRCIVAYVDSIYLEIVAPPRWLPFHHFYLKIFIVLAWRLIETRTPMSPKRFRSTPEPEEETPLLRDENPPRKETPLPITQILVLLFLQSTEPVMSFSIRPYINQVRSSIPITQVIGNVSHSLSVSSQSSVVTKERLDTTQD